MLQSFGSWLEFVAADMCSVRARWFHPWELKGCFVSILPRYLRHFGVGKPHVHSLCCLQPLGSWDLHCHSCKVSELQHLNCTIFATCWSRKPSLAWYLFPALWRKFALLEFANCKTLFGIGIICTVSGSFVRKTWRGRLTELLFCLPCVFLLSHLQNSCFTSCIAWLCTVLLCTASHCNACGRKCIASLCRASLCTGYASLFPLLITLHDVILQCSALRCNDYSLQCKLSNLFDCDLFSLLNLIC